ncbi:L-alanine-DL-glutamate epimerase-like enolase superfamily enzyme [Murinocardiopsis flavida]|uniref:L-alanine-DL-glutamate epimerase-like enolase superfamily enzyme n=1 Tax=Murinocardiopsis flavida TaxID=645275 RepID=A0A2P8DF96_9ACTN|nr:mandelate racemase/muconate lactonizing enzyme family protein [Murinocardiopsis flavida]PSK95884.1 L-alanine-DL-glutamate epimerase-like enolase superfamily enzyme [Murinocardiopsis flavida]
MSRITAARLRVLRAPAADGIAMSFAPLRHRSAVLVELDTDDGLTGHGESWINYPPWAASERVATLREGVFPRIVGADPRDIGAVHRSLCAGLEPLGRQWGAPGPVMQAISAVDIALWDLAGHASGLAMSRVAGDRVREEVAVYASSLGPGDVAAQARRCVAAGHDAVKVKLGFGRADDERILAEARGVLGAAPALYADANQAWDLAEAAAMAPILRAYDVAWIEEPLRGNRLPELEELHRRTGLPIATGENVYGIGEFRRLAASPAIAVLQPDIAKAGGITEALAVCEAAAAHGTAVLPHLYGGAVAFAATLQLAAMARPVAAVEYDIRDNPLRDPLLVDPPVPDRGRIAVPDAPGLGIPLDTAAIAAVTRPHPREEPES